MTRHSCSRGWFHFLSLAAVPAILLFTPSISRSAAAAEKPNIVLILADDVSADMFSCYGQPGTAGTPNIDRIAGEGVQFRTCFAPAICAPSRALLMTGVYGNRTGVFRYWYPSIIQNGKYVEVTESDFGPDIRCQFLMDFMERMVQAGQPFVAYWPTVIPHGPYSTTPDIGAVLDIELAKPNTSGMSREKRAQAITDYGRKQQQRFVNLIEYMDKLIGKLIRKAEELGICDDTYFIFCTDNGTAVTAKDRGVERGVHVPYVVKGPGVLRRGVTDELTDFADIAPTLVDMAGIAYPTDVALDGKSQLPFLTGRTDTHRAWIYAYTGPVQVLRTMTHLLEARAPFYGKPNGRFYFTGNHRFGRGYVRVDGNPEHAKQRAKFESIIRRLPSHLETDHPFWTSKLGRRWLQKNDISEIAKKQIYNHPDYSFYDETD